MPPGAPRAAVVLSGNELLDGRTRDTNGAFVCDDLSRRGVKVTELAHRRRRPRAPRRPPCGTRSRGDPDLLVVGGGLGTTHDDLTAECLAEVLGVPLEEDAGRARRASRSASASSPSAGTSTTARRSASRGARRSSRPAPLPCRRPASRPASPRAPGGRASSPIPACPTNFSRCGSRRPRRSSASGFFPDVVVRMVRVFGVGELQVGPILDALPHDLVELGINVGGGEVAGAHPPPPRRRRAGAGRRPGAPRWRPACPCTRPTAAPSTTSSPTSCAAAASPWPSPSPAPAACSAPASPPARAAPTTSPAA